MELKDPKPSSPPAWVMKPKPLASLHHLTVPCAIEPTTNPEACAAVKPRHHGRGALQEWRANKNAERLDARAALVANRLRQLAVTESRVNQHRGPRYRPFSRLSSNNAELVSGPPYLTAPEST